MENDEFLYGASKACEKQPESADVRREVRRFDYDDAVELQSSSRSRMKDQDRSLGVCPRIPHRRPLPTRLAELVRHDLRNHGDDRDEDVPSSVELRWRPSDVQAASSLL